MRSPTDASPIPSRVPTHGSGPMRFATPSPWWTCTTCSLPVLTGAPEVDPGNGTGGLIGSRCRSVVVDGADDGEDETEDRCGTEGEDRAGGVAGAGDCGRSGAALSGSPEPGLCLEEAAAAARGAGVRPHGRPGSRRAS